VPGIELEPLGPKALRPLAVGRPKRRNDGFDLAVFKGGVNAAERGHENDARLPAACDERRGHRFGVETLGAFGMEQGFLKPLLDPDCARPRA